MPNNKGSPNSSWLCSGRTSKLPPRCPLPSTNHASVDCTFVTPAGKKHNSPHKEKQKQHQRTSSESFIVEEQPSWLDDLLNEPETPSGRGTHRRSSSDSITYVDMLRTSSKGQSIPQHELSKTNILSILPTPLSRPFNMQKDTTDSTSLDISSSSIPSIRGWESSINSFSYQNCAVSMGDSNMLANCGHSRVQLGMDCFMMAKQELDKSRESDHTEFSEKRESSFVKCTASDLDQRDQNGYFGRKEECLHGKPTAPDIDPKRTKQHFAQRSRVRKLQYIAELERVVSLLHAEGSDMAAELTFLKQQHVILSLENNALVQRIGSIAQEKQIKEAQYELLRREADRLREIYCNQRCERSKPQQCDNTIGDAADHLDLQFGCLSLDSLNDLETGSAKVPGGLNRVGPYPCMMLQKS